MSDFIEKILDWLSGSRQDRPPADQLKWGFGALSSVLTKAIIDKPGIRGSQDLKIDDTTARTDYTFCFPPVFPGSAHSDPRYCFVAQVINLEQTNDSEASRSTVLLQSSVENPHSFYKDVREYAGTLDSVPSGGSFAIMATMARYSYEAWESYNVASEASARLLVRESQVYRSRATMLTSQLLIVDGSCRKQGPDNRRYGDRLPRPRRP